MPDGGHFVGGFNANFRPHGEGVRFAADGAEVASGQWRNGGLLCRGKIALPDGDHYEGELVAGQMSGLGTLAFVDGRVFEGEFDDGQRSGLGVEWNKDGEMDKCGRWADGQFENSGPVPRSKIPIGSRLSAHGPIATAALQSH